MAYLYGTSFADYLSDTIGDDVIFGLNSDDVIRITTGDDVVLGGNGNDIVEIEGNLSDYTFAPPDGTGMIRISHADYGTKLLIGVEYIRDASGDVTQVAPEYVNRLYGSSNDDVISDSSEKDVILANAGDDTINLTTGDDQVWGGDGTDTVIVQGDLSDYELSYEEINGVGQYNLVSELYGEKVLHDVEFIQDQDGDVIDLSDANLLS